MTRASEYNNDIVIDIINVISEDESVKDIEESIILTSESYFKEIFSEIMERNESNPYVSLLELIDTYNLCVDDIKTINKYMERGHKKLIEDYVKKNNLHIEKVTNTTVQLF